MPVCGHVLVAQLPPPPGVPTGSQGLVCAKLDTSMDFSAFSAKNLLISGSELAKMTRYLKSYLQRGIKMHRFAAGVQSEHLTIPL